MRIVLIGSGNVATHLATGLHSAGHEFAGVWSRNCAHARELAEKIGAPAVEDCSALPGFEPDAVLLSLADSCAREVIAALPSFRPGTVALHTSGTLPQEVLLPLSSDCGILYPLQTFSKNVPVRLSEVPFFIEGITDRAADCARTLASSLSAKVRYADAAHRKALHIAGVLSCNFPNYLWECCEKILGDAGYPLEVIEPLVRATVDKCFAVGPHSAQTGPARRRDTAVIRAHADSLPPQLADVYLALSSLIIKSHYE